MSTEDWQFIINLQIAPCLLSTDKRHGELCLWHMRKDVQNDRSIKQSYNESASFSWCTDVCLYAKTTTYLYTWRSGEFWTIRSWRHMGQLQRSRHPIFIRHSLLQYTTALWGPRGQDGYCIPYISKLHTEISDLSSTCRACVLNEHSNSSSFCNVFPTAILSLRYFHKVKKSVVVENGWAR